MTMSLFRKHLSYRPLALTLLGALALLASACKEQALEKFPFEVLIESDPGVPLANVQLMFGADEAGKTDAMGKSLIYSTRTDGQSLVIAVKCPDGTQPTEPITVKVQRTESKAPTHFQRTCKPSNRPLAVVIRAEEGYNLPVLYLGKEVARTDASGAAHFTSVFPIGERVELTLNAAVDPKLKPATASRPFMVGDSDDVTLWQPKFEREKPAPKPVYVKPKKIGPIQIP
jgi:hypothetical protein